MPLTAPALPIRPRAPVWRARVVPVAVVLGARTLLVAFALLLNARQDSGDIPFYYALAAEALKGRLPYMHFWVEYPPVFPWLVVGLLRLAQALWPANPQPLFAALLLGVNLLASYANLILVYLLLGRLYGPAQAFKSGLIYAVLLPPVRFALQGMIDPLADTFLLGGLALLLLRRADASGLLAAAGVLTKVYPGVLLPAALALLPAEGRTRWVKSFALAIGAVLLLLMLVSPRALVSSLEVSARRPPWESVWALVEGCCAYGKLPAPAERGVTLAGLPESAAHLPWLVIGLGFAAAFVLVARARWRPVDERAAVLLTLFSVGLLLLWSKGFSPQFVQWILPLVLIAFPVRAGPLLAVGYTGLVFLQYAPPAGAPDLVAPVYTFIVVSRTALSLIATLLAALAWIDWPRVHPGARIGST